MSKYYKFEFSAGYAGTDTEEVFKFSEDVSEDDVQEAFDDWYNDKRRDCGAFNEISQEEAEEAGINEDLED